MKVWLASHLKASHRVGASPGRTSFTSDAPPGEMPASKYPAPTAADGSAEITPGEDLASQARQTWGTTLLLSATCDEQ